MNKKLVLIVAVALALMVSLVGTGVMSANAAKGPGTPDAAAEFVSDEILVKFEPGTSAADIAKFHRSQGAKVKSQIPQIGIQVLKVPSGRVLEKAAAYEKNPNVLYAEPNYIRVLSPGLPKPGDPYFDDQWALNNTAENVGTEDADIDWLEAYDYLSGQTLGSVIIAVNDTGIDLSHPDLNDKLLVLLGSDIIGNDDDPSDEYGHGTHVAGIAAAETNNAEGIAGVAFGTLTKIMPVRIFDENGETTIEAICNGLVFAADNGANVINMSYGGLRRSRTEADAVKYAWNRGAVLVAAAGNYGEYINAATWKNYPAAYDEVMAVSATNHSDALAYYSSYGSWLSVAAPGGEMFSETDYLGGILSTYPESWYAWWHGTSMAAPHVSGLAGLLFAQYPTRSNQEVRSIIEETADDLGNAGFDAIYGYGRINADAAIQYGAPPATGTISGTVTDADTKEPIAGATVTADGYSTETGTDGTYILADLPVGSYNVTASATGYIDESKPADVLESQTTVVDFALSPETAPATGTISGTVTDAETAEPIAGATVTADGYTTETGAYGTYTLADLPEGTYTVTASADGFESASQIVTVLESATTTADFALTPETAPPGVTVTVSIGMLPDSRTAGPNEFVWAIAMVTIEDEYSDAVEGATVSGHWDGATSDSDSGTTDPNGDVSLKSDSVKNPPSGTTFIFVVDRVTKGDVIYELPSDTSGSITI